MPRPRKPRKPITNGNAIKLIQQNATVRLQIRDEEERHRAKLTDLSDREHEVQVFNITPAVRAARLTRITHQRVAEIKRHHAAMDRLQRRFR